jgi:isoquinoline 1-oxidoreductase beta subunit
MVEVEVTPQGEVRLRRAVAAVDVGLAVNPSSIEAQVQGGVLFGLSAALYNAITLKNGAFEQSNFHDYRMLRMNEVPRFEVYRVDNSESPGGLGEVGTAIAAPALGNAIFAATGVRLRSLPVDRHRLAENAAALTKVAV